MLPDATTSKVWRWTTHLLTATALASVAGCASFSGIAPQAKALSADELGLQSQAGGSAVPAPVLPADWWLGFGDTQLTDLVQRALAHNPNLRLAQARLARVQVASAAIDASGGPQLNLGLDAMRQRITEHGIYPPPLAGAVLDTATLQANASWELDFFGKNRTALDAALGQAAAAQLDADAARMLLASNVARSYFALQRIQAQLAVAERTLAQRERLLQLVVQRVSAGLDTQLEYQQNNASTVDARLQIEVMKEQEALAQHALAAWVGEPNGLLARVNTAQAAMQTIANPMALPATIPVDLLGRRADIAAARARIEAATQDVGNAKTLFYPNINLVAFAGFSSIGFDKLLQSGSDQWGVGPAIRLPLFDGGHLRANLRSKTADLDAAIETYNALVIDAVRDAADQLASTRAIALQQTQQAAAQTAAQKTYDIAVDRYQAGLGNALQVLGAESAVLAQRRQGIDLAARARDTQVQLIRALGGGYAPATVPATHTTLTLQSTPTQP